MTVKAIKLTYLDSNDSYIKKDVFFSDRSGFFTENETRVVDSNQILSETQALRLAKHIFRSQE
jgi:hypothetical protein